MGSRSASAAVAALGRAWPATASFVSVSHVIHFVPSTKPYLCFCRRSRHLTTTNNTRPQCSHNTAPSVDPRSSAVSLFDDAVDILTTSDPILKAEKSRAACQRWQTAQEFEKQRHIEQVHRHNPRNTDLRARIPRSPSRPDKPTLVPSTKMPNVKSCGTSAAVFFLHAVAHVELNAIDLCWDTMLRFGVESLPPPPSPSSLWDSTKQLPVAFFDDFVSVADDESRHYMMLDTRLKELGSSYGVHPAHELIWQSADRSRDSLSARLALGQLVQEARGLDAGPRLVSRLHGMKDGESARIIDVIATEEVDHVRIGMRWFLYACEKECVHDPIAHFQRIALAHANAGALFPPFNEDARASVGLMPQWYWPVAQQMLALSQQHRNQHQQHQPQKQRNSPPPPTSAIPCESPSPASPASSSSSSP